MERKTQSVTVGDVVSDLPDRSLDEFCRACGMQARHIEAYVAEGVIDAHGPTPAQWRFSHLSVVRMRRARRLEQDLGLNLPGVALALELMAEIEDLRNRLQRFEQIDGDQVSND